jgi:signal transduction histidine kinase/ActR/RegA family two-component response regulator
MRLGPRVRTLRFRLFLLAASGVLPLAIVAGVVLAYLTGARERDALQTALDVSRALATAVDAELRSTSGVLQSLAFSDELDPPVHLDDFRALSRRVATDQAWRTVILTAPDGSVVMNSTQDPAPGQSLKVVDPASLRQALDTGRPVVGNVAVGPQQRAAFAVRVPVLRGDKLLYVLSAVVPVERILAVVQGQQLPPSTVVAVYDAAGNRVARSRYHPSMRASPSLQALIASGKPEGSGITSTLEGTRSHSGFARVSRTGWVVATGISAEDVDHGFYGVLGAVLAGLLGSLGLAALAAWYFGRDVSEPIHALKAAAAALGRGEPVHLEPLEIAELQEVGAVLVLASAEREQAAQQRRAAEVEREMLLERATEALQRAEEAGRSKDEFLAMLGHELRNPLAPMTTALHLMARKGDPGTRGEREVMERQVAHMRRLVDDLLDVSRITGKRLTMQLQPLRVAEVARHAAQSVQPALGLRRFELDIAREAESLWVSADEVRLGQVLSNLLGNAIKFTGPQGCITLRVRHAGAAAEIAVSDDGVGMPPDVLEHVFDLFYQAPQDADRSRGGLGLGLAIVRSLVEMHGGSVEALSDGQDQGSTVVVRLPLVDGPAQAVAPTPAIETTGDAARVLVVDDNQDAADTAAALLEIAGYTVQVAYDPGVALTLLDEHRPAVAVLDIGLPGISGYELAQRIRAHRNGQHCHLIALTGYGTAADVARAQDAGFQRHLVKPATPDALLHAVQEGLEASNERQT